MTDNNIPIFSEELAKAQNNAEQANQNASATPLPSDVENVTESAPYNFTEQPSVASVEASEGEKSDIVVPMRPQGEEPGDATTPMVETTQATQPNDAKPKASTPKAKPVKYPIAYNDDDLKKAYGLLTEDERKGIDLATDEGKASMSAMVDKLKMPNRLVVGADGKQQRVYLPYDPDDTSSEAYTASQKPIEVIGTEGKRGGMKLGIPLAEIMDNPSSVRWQFGDTTITGMQPITGGVTQAKVKDLESASYTTDGKPILTFNTTDGQTQKVILNATKADVDKARSERNAVAEVDLRSKEALLQARQKDIDSKLSKAMHDEGYTTPDITQGVDDGNSLSSLVRLYLLPRINPKTAPLANAYDANKATLDKIQAIKTNIANGNTSSGTIDDIVKSGSEVLGGFLSKVSKASTWDNGVSELSLATYGKKAYDKYMAGGKLTDDEQAMLDAIGYSLYFDEMYKDNLHNANLGAGVAESLPYAINIAIAGWTGAGKAVGNATETSITKALKSRLLKRYGETAIARWLPSIASKATSAMTEAGVATGVGGLKQEADALQRMTGDVDTSTIDATGHATYDKDSKVDGGGMAHYKAFGAGLIENLSEMAEPYIAMIPRGIKSVVSNKMANLAKKSGTFNTLYDAMASLKPSQLSQVLDAGLRKGKINGLFEEVAGEVAGNIANAALIGDMSFTIDKESPDWQNSVFNPDVNADIVAQSAIMSYGFRVPGAIADATYNAHKAASAVKTNIMGKKAFGDKWQDVKATIDAMSPEDAVEFASNAVKEQSDGCEAVYRYAIQSKGEQLANNINANKDDNANDITDVAHETAVNAVDAPIAEARQAVKVAQESSQEMPNSLKVSIDALVDNDASDGEVKSLFDQLSDAERPMAEQYYLAQVQLKGHEVGATARADAETEQFADAVSDMSTEIDGNAVVMTAEVDGEQKVIKSKGDTMTILADGTAVTSDKVTDVKTSPVEDIIEIHRSQALQSEMDKLDFAKSHNPNTINPNSGDVVMGADGNQYVYNEATTTNSDGSQVTQTCLYPAIPSEDGGIVADTNQPLLQGISKDEVLAMQDRYYDSLDNNATQGTTRNEEASDATESVEDNTTDADTNVNDATQKDSQQTEEPVETPNEEQSIDQGGNQTEVSQEQENNTDAQPKDINVTDASKIADTYVSKISKARASKSDSVRKNADKLVSAFAKKAKASSTTDLGEMVSRLASQTDNDTAIELLDIANKELQSRKSARKGKANEAPQSDNDVQATEATQATESPITEEANTHLAESEQKAKERMKYLTPTQVARLMRIGKVAKSMGLGIRFVDTMEDNGLYDPTTNTITIALDAENPIEVVFGHEVTHGLRNQSEEAYQSLRNAVMATIPSDAFKARVASTKRLYEDAEQKGYDDEYYEEEAVCDLVGELVGKSDILSNLKRNADYKVLGWMHSVVKSIMGVLRRGDKEYKKFSEAEKAFRQAYLDAVNRESYIEAGGYLEDDMSKVPIRSSVRSITTGIGLKPIKDDGNGNFVLEGNDGKKFDSEHPVTAEYLAKISQYDENRQCSPMAYLIHDALTEGHIGKSDLPSVFKTYADILNLYLNIGKAEYGGFDNLSDTFLWLGDSVYKTVATNSDTQYKLSLDITRVCKKNEAVIRAISEMQRREGYGITPGQILEIYEASNRAGYQVPCPVCYVFTRYIRNGQFATIMINGQRKYGHLLKNPDTMTEEEKTEAIEFWKKELAMVEAENASNKNAIKSAKEDIVTIQTEINNLAKIITDPANHNVSEISNAKKKVTELDKRYRAALDVVSQSSLDSWIRIFAISEHNGKFSLVRDSYKGFPDEVALDLRLTSLAKREYPAIQRFRNSRGSGAGKEITFESDNAIGDVALGLSSKGHAEMLAEAGDFTNEEKEILKDQYGEDYEKMLGRKNYYLLASECSDSKTRRKILNDASKAFNKARVYLEQQTLRGGQRMWSWSDNIESLSPDVVINLMQLQMLGGGLQTYSKQLEGIAMVASLGGYVNGSLMGKGNGVREVQEEDTYQLNGNEYLIGGDYTTTDAQGNETILRTLVYKDNNGKRFVLEFDNVVGAEPFGHDGKKGLFDLNATMDKAGNIIVGMNDTHIRTAMADDRIFFIIPWHSSGANNHVLSQMYRILQVKYAREESTDYTKMQDDKFVDEGGKYPKGLAEYFESHKRDDIPCAFGNIESSSEDGESLSESQIKYRRLREYTLLGYPTEGKGGNSVRVDVSNYPELMEEITKDYFLNKVYNTVHERVSTQSMTPDDITHIYPYEYWLTDSTLDNADENTAYYIEYCRRLGVKPKFCGSLPGTGHGNFLDDKGAWKLLIDRRMYDTNGNYQDIDSVSVKGFSTDLIDPRETAKKYDVTKVADKSATGEIVSDVMEKEKSILGKNLSVNYDTNLNDAVSIYNQIKSSSTEQNNKNVRKSVRKDVASETIEEDNNNDTSVGELLTRYSVRKKPAPQKTKKAYKLFKVDVNGNPHALFIDKASNLEQGIWYDADCPNIDSIKNLDAGYTYLMDMDGVVYDKKPSDYKLNKGEVKEASEKGLRWMSVTEGAKGTKLVRNVGINGSGTVSMYALRPGWHATSAPSARHIGSKDGGKEVKYRRPDERWFEIEISADNDYNDEARELYMASHPKAKRDDVYANMKGDITDKIPEDGFYNFKTNSNANPKQSWYISGSIRIVRPIGEKEAQRICDKEGVAHDLPYKDGIKNFTDDEQGLMKSAEEAVSAYKEEAERPKPLVSAILHSIRGGKRNVPIDPFVEGWDSIISSDAFKLEETLFDSLKAVEEFQRYMTGSKDVPDYLNAHRALMVLSSVNKAQMDMFAGTYVENLRKSIEEMVGTAEMNKGFYAEDGALAELDRFLKAQHGLERNRDMRVRAKLSEIYNDKIAEAQVAYNQTQDKKAYNDAVKKAQEEYNVALEAFYAKRDEIVAEGLESGDNWYLINTKLDDYVIETLFKSDKKDARGLTLDEINALKAKRDELLERAKNEQWSARRLQEALDKMLSEESFKSITGNKKMVSLPATKEYYDELAGLTGMFNWGNTPLGVYLANEEAKQFVSWYKGTENKESLDAVEKAIADINDFSLKKQKESGLVDEEYVQEQKRRYLNFVPLRDFMDVSSDDMYDYLTGNAGVGGNPVKTAKGRHSEAGPAIAGLINVANRSITAGNRNLALQKMYNIVKAKGVNTLANARNRWIVRDSENTNKWHDAEPEISPDATAEQVTTQLADFEERMKALEEQGLARRVDGKRSPSEYRIMSRTQMDEHKIKVAIGGRQYIIDFLGNPRAAQAANGMTNPDVSDDAGRTLFRTFKNFLASAFTSKNIAFSVANFFRDTEHSNNYVFIKEGGEYYRRFTERQLNKFKYRSYMKEIFSKLKMFREGKLSEDDTFYQFMNNGGATGYTFVQSQEEEAEKFVKELVEAKNVNWGKKMWNRFFDMVEYMGNVSELTNRYIAFLTSREMGRSIGRSIEDAKEVTLNFNRKGSGTKTKIDGLLPKYIPSVVEYGQRYILFFNANVQAKRQLLYMLKENPAKTTGARIGRAAFYRMMIPAIFAGVFLPAINDIVLPAIYSALGFDDDDDDEKYDYFNKLGDYERSHSINFALPNNAFLSIPVSPDIAPFMSIGDVISAQMQNKRDMTFKDFIEAGSDIISPININYGSEDDINWTAVAMSFFPSQISPIGEVFVNTNFMGQPIYKGGGIGNRKYTPEYKKGMRRTSPALTAWSKFVNDISGGDDVEKGAMDGLFNNPAVMEHLLKGYLGGYATATLDMVINPLYNSLTGDFKDLSLKAEQLPLVGRFYKGGSRDEQMRRMERTFRNEVYERNAETRAQESELKKEAMKANREGQLYRLAELRNKYIQLVQSDKYRKYYATKQASEAISDQLKLTSTMTDNEKRYLIDMMRRTIGIYRGEIKIYGTPSEDNQ